MAVQERYDAQHIFVVFVVAYSLGIGFEERHILRLRELPAELIDIDRLIVIIRLVIVEGSLRYEVDDIVLAVYSHHRSIHPCLVLGDEGEVGVGIVCQEFEHAVVKDQVALNEQCVVFLQFVLRKGQRIDIVGLVVDGIFDIFDLQLPIISVAYVVDEVLSLITYYDDNPVEFQFG